MLACALTAGTGIITKTELKCFYTAFLDVGKLGEQKILEITDSAFEALTSVILVALALNRTAFRLSVRAWNTF